MTEPLRHEARMPLSSDTLSTALANLLPIQRYAMRRGYLMMATGGTSTFTTKSKGTKQTADDAILGFLKKKSATTFNSGFSSAEISKSINYGKTITSTSLQKLVEKGTVATEKQKNNIKYFFPQPESETHEEPKSEGEK